MTATDFLFDQSSPATGDAAMRRIKNHLVSGGFTVPSSADGSTYNASGDQITTDSGAGSFATSGAWARWRAPGGAYEILVQRGASSVQWRALQSVAGFVGGSPSATRCPTATDQQVINGIGGGTDASPTYSTLFPTDGTYRLFAGIGTVVDNYDVWAFAQASGGGSAPKFVMFANKMTAGTYPSADADPRHYLFDYDGTAVATVARVASIGAGAPHARSGSNWRRAPFQNLTFGGISVVNAGGVHAVSGDAYPASSHVWLAESGPTYYGPKGSPANLRWCCETTAVRPYGGVLTDPDGARWIRCGDLYLRIDSATTVTL